MKDNMMMMMMITTAADKATESVDRGGLYFGIRVSDAAKELLMRFQLIISYMSMC
jgi:hypothetical protein